MKLVIERIRARRRSIRRSLRAVWGSPTAVVGLGLILLFGIAALIHPVLLKTVWPAKIYDPLVGFDFTMMHPADPSSAHLLGTDALGRDVLSMILAASRPAWVVALTAAITTGVIATFIGALGAFYRGWVDGVLSHVSDAFLLLPAPIFVLIIAEQVELSPVRFGLVFGLINGLGAGAIVMRSQGLKVMAEPFIEAARVAGGGGLHILVRHLVPHLMPLAVLYMMLSVVGAIVAHGFAAFLGQTESLVSWGAIVFFGITSARSFSGAVPWSALISASAALSLFAGAFYLVSSGLREIFDPRLRAR
ncbi:MAG: ABC transporter permease subunit [Gammaproteobacteria bacterium]|nr:ABC transporter permease subunit [Gammaproteobacteria bacterium]